MFEVKQSVYESIANRDNRKSLYNRILNLENITSKRAKLIARDQAAKILSDTNIYNQQQAGIEYLLWQTANDERVSTGKGGHRQLHNNIYRYNDKSNYPIIDTRGKRGFPAQRVNCRCTDNYTFYSRESIQIKTKRRLGLWNSKRELIT